MTAAVLVLLGMVVGFFSREAIRAVVAVHRERQADTLSFQRHQAVSDIAAHRRRAEEQMRRLVFRRRG
ncbi:hypothetical protein ACFUIY_19445 [Streptomyces griseorubiginosus]|uniref:hypothetical protein n=1 Tax=Streptomyces griseorubiginosus TaxID=67304 RepID=UPI0036321BAD